jgi:hypothetical protein
MYPPHPPFHPPGLRVGSALRPLWSSGPPWSWLNNELNNDNDDKVSTVDATWPMDIEFWGLGGTYLSRFRFLSLSLDGNMMFFEAEKPPAITPSTARVLCRRIHSFLGGKELPATDSPIAAGWVLLLRCRRRCVGENNAASSQIESIPTDTVSNQWAGQYTTLTPTATALQGHPISGQPPRSLITNIAALSFYDLRY